MIESLLPAATQLVVALLAAAPTPAANFSADALASDLARAAPNADREVLGLAARALACVRAREPATSPKTLSVIDYSKPSTERRLWVFDLSLGTLLFEEWVAHGRNSGDNFAQRFSNDAGSLMSSVGLFVTQDTYTGHNGYSLRLRGLDAGFNDRALERAIVMHGADYVSERVILGQGRLGRSFGCPAVRREIAPALINTIRDGSLVFAYFPVTQWLNRSPFVGGCVSSASAPPVETSP